LHGAARRTTVIAMPAPLRFLVVGTFTAAPRGDRITVSGERMADVMARLPMSAQLVVDDKLGDGKPRTYALELGSPRALRIADVCADHEPMRTLADIATALARPRDAIDVPTAIARVKAAVGEGSLTRALASLSADLPAPAAVVPAPASPTPAPAPSGGISIDSIFDKAAMPPEQDTVRAAKSGLDAFIGAIRGQRNTTATSASSPLAPRAAALVLDAIEATAADLLAHEPAAAIEASWRGLKLLLGNSPGHAELAIDVLDVAPTAVLATLSHALDRGAGVPPDAVFVLPPQSQHAVLGELAQLAETSCVPIAFTLDPHALDGGDDSSLAAWNELRNLAGMGWLCAVTNDIVLANENTRVGPRVVFGAPVLALATMLAASLRRDHTFGDAFGRAGAIVSPASHHADDGKGHARELPTRTPIGFDAQRAMAAAGITVIGSEPAGERLVVVGAPMIASGDGPSLAGRILVGRAVRAAITAREGLTVGATPHEIDTALARAAAGLLPEAPGLCTLRGRSVGDHLQIEAELRAGALGRAFAFGFKV
jgi:type VI secretion system protein ImpC